MTSCPIDLEDFRRRIERLRVENRRLHACLAEQNQRLIDHRSRVRGVAVPPPSLKELTPREVEVLRCIAEGSSTKDVSVRLGIAFKTAACHRHRLMQKLDVHSTSALVRRAIQAGVVRV